MKKLLFLSVFIPLVLWPMTANATNQYYQFPVSGVTANSCPGGQFATAISALGILTCSAGGSGTVVGPGSSTTNDLPIFADSSGALISDSGVLYTSLAPKSAPVFTTSITTPIVISSTANPASAGFLRMAKSDMIEWRDNANSGNNYLKQRTDNDFEISSGLYVIGNSGVTSPLLTATTSIYSPVFISNSAAPTAVSGDFRLPDNKKISWRSVNNDQDFSIYLDTGNVLHFGAEVSYNFDSNVPIYAGGTNGKGSPAYSFTGATSSGMYHNSGVTGFSDANTAMFNLDGAGHAIQITQALELSGIYTNSGDTNATVTAGEIIHSVTALTATRTITIPRADSFNPGYWLTIKDQSGAASPTVKITVAPAVGTIQGSASMSITVPYGYLMLVSDVDNKWYVISDGTGTSTNPLGLTGIAKTTVNCSTSGTAIFSQPFQGASYSKVTIIMAACLGTASYTYPTAMANTPGVIATGAVAAGIATSVSTTAVTVTGTTTTGWLFLEGY